LQIWHEIDTNADGQSARRAMVSPGVRASAAYNMACASAQLGHADEAEAELRQALKAGFLDFGLMESDGDLELLREAGRLPMPREHEYQVFKHRAVKIPYVVLLPEGHDPELHYPAALAYAPGDRGIRATDYTLNALMKEVTRSHKVLDDRFHFIGLGAGAHPASIYAGMSRQYVASLTLVDNLPFAGWDARELDELAEYGFPIRFLVAAYGGSEAERLQRTLVAAGGNVDVDIDPKQTPLLPGVKAARVLGKAVPETP
jgi:hypothetical protein